jgi:hypothetical protein
LPQKVRKCVFMKQVYRPRFCDKKSKICEKSKKDKFDDDIGDTILFGSSYRWLKCSKCWKRVGTV